MDDVMRLRAVTLASPRSGTATIAVLQRQCQRGHPRPGSSWSALACSLAAANSASGDGPASTGWPPGASLDSPGARTHTLAWSPQVLITSWKCGAPCRTAGRPLAKLSAKPPENRRKTAGKPLAKTVGKPPKTAGESPVFGSLLPVSISDRNGRKGSLRRHFSAPGGGCHKGPAFQAQLMYFSKRWGWRNGDLRVFRRDEGPSRCDDAKIGISL